MLKILIFIFAVFISQITLAADGYYQYPAISKDNIVFVSDNDLWLVNKKGGETKRLTSINADIITPVFSPDGNSILFVSNHNSGYDIYKLEMNGKIERLTFISASYMRLSTWASHNIAYFTSNHKSHFIKDSELFKIDVNTKIIEKQNYGPVKFFSTNGKQKAIQRIQYREFGYWKGYKGGATGDMWLDNGNGNFNEIFKTESNLTMPTIIGGRVFFLSDKDGPGNLYSVNFEGKDLRQHTNFKDYYARNFRTDGDSIVFTAGGDIYVYDISAGKYEKIAINFTSNKNAQNIKFPNIKNHIEHYSPHPKQDIFAQIIRGHAVITHYFDDYSFEIGNKQHRYRIAEWAKDGEYLILSSSFKDSDCVYILDGKNFENKYDFKGFKFGRISSIIPANKTEKFIVTNESGDIFLVNYGKGAHEVLKIDRTNFWTINSAAWSDDDMHVVYNYTDENRVDVIKMYSVRNNESNIITDTSSNSFTAKFDSKNKFLYFLSDRNFVPYTDYHDFRVYFPMHNRPYLMSLKRENILPFNAASGTIDLKDKPDESSKETKDIKSIINIDHSYRRVVPFPVADMIYLNIFASGDKVWFLAAQPQNVLDPSFKGMADNRKSLYMFDFSKNKMLPVADGIDDAVLTKNGENFLIKVGQELRLISSAPNSNPSQPAELTSNDYGADSGWIVNDPNLYINTKEEWRKIYKESWSNMKDRFNNPKKTINWSEIYDKYKPLIDKVSTRLELNDVLWEMHGELETSHAYVFGGDIVEPEKINVAKLGADFVYDDSEKAYRFKKIYRGEPWNPNASSPLKYPGVNVRNDDILYSVNNIKLTKDMTPEMALVNASNGRSVVLEVAFANSKNRRMVHVNPLDSELDIYYKEYVKKNSDYVKKKTDNKVCYIHIPDMMPRGFTLFYKNYLKCYNNAGIILDIRNNAGGYVSSQILDFVTRHRIGHKESVIDGKEPYPNFASKGNFVLLTNQYTGSDGDIFANAFKFLRLGPVIGKRTWGGVIGIRFDKALVDGTITSQPEFASWFANTGYDIENFGVEPSIEVDNTPNDYIKDKDAQLDKAIEEVNRLIQENN